MTRLWKALHGVLVVLQYFVFVPLVVLAIPFIAALFVVVVIREAVETKLARTAIVELLRASEERT